MSNGPVFNIDLAAFHADPYPTLKEMRATNPIAYVPQLDAILMSKRADIFKFEKMTDVFSSVQPDGLMVKLMGQNMMRKDGEDHMAERRAIFPTVSPKTVKNVWLEQFAASATEILDSITGKGHGDLVRDFAMPLSADALRAMTGLTNMARTEMDRVSQGMIDGCSNFSGNSKVTANCHDCTASVDRHINEMLPILRANPDYSLLSSQLQSGLSEAQYRANIKLVISGGQNEPRDVIAGAIWALLTHPEQRERVENGPATWLQVFEEYTRWNSPIGMSPRRITRRFDIGEISLEPEDKVFFMFSSANRDEDFFKTGERFDLAHDTGPSIAFGAGPHFCAGAWAARALIAKIALPMVFERLKNLRISDVTAKPVGWAFRGIPELLCEWDC